jgi:Mlc titration factor MtfA (ptsG expression regulator)
MGFFTERRRRKLRQLPCPASWLALIERHVPHFALLPVADRQELTGHLQVLLAEKQFEGRGGLTLTDEIRVTVAAQAALLLLHRQTDYFAGLSSVILYPDEYRAPVWEADEIGIVTEGIDSRVGEFYPGGALVLSWRDILGAGKPGEDDYNVILHEFAHYLDAADGISAGMQENDDWTRLPRRLGILLREYETLQQEVAAGRETVLDPYGAEHPAEFFAVATECFFGLPRLLSDHHPELYDVLRDYYRQDPTVWELLK